MEPNRWFRSPRDFLDLDALAQHLYTQFQKRQSQKYFVKGGWGYPLSPVEAPGEEEGVRSYGIFRCLAVLKTVL